MGANRLLDPQPFKAGVALQDLHHVRASGVSFRSLRASMRRFGDA